MNLSQVKSVTELGILAKESNERFSILYEKWTALRCIPSILPINQVQEPKRWK